MAEWAYTSTTRDVDCPRCGRPKGERCRTPKGRLRPEPHTERFRAYCDSISREEFQRRHSVRTYTIQEILGRAKNEATG